MPEQVVAGRFHGSAVLVTGGAHGIGRACAVRLASEGAHVVVADLDLEAANQVVGSLASSGTQRHLALEVDVTDDASVQRGVRAMVDHLGGLDVLVNVAGGGAAHSRFELTDDETWSRMLELNLLGVVRCCRAAIPHLRASTAGPSIVTIASVNGLIGLAGEQPYSAAKAGVVSLTANLALDLGGEGIRVNAVAPGTIRTRVWDDQEGGADRMLPLYALGRVGEPEDVAGAVAFLASADASWVTGHCLPVDGGLMAGRRLS